MTATGPAQPSELDENLRQAAEWVGTHRAEIPEFIYNCIMSLVALRAELNHSKAVASRLLLLFRQQLGVIPKSERGPRPSPLPEKSDEERLALLKAQRAKLSKEIRGYENRLGKRRKKEPKDSASDKQSPEEAPSGTPEFLNSGETLFSGRLAEGAEEAKGLGVNKERSFENPVGLHSTKDKRKRYEFFVTTKTIMLSVETVTDPRTGKSVTASTDEIGPPNSQATWVGIANAIIAIIGYAIPINRLATMLKSSCPYFTSSRLCSYLKLAAELFAPIYTYLGEALSDSDVLLGDDAKVRVLEINRALKDGGELQEPVPGSLIAKMAIVFGRVFPKKSGKGNKRSLNVSVVIGKTVAIEPRSYVFFFRSHLGSFGDLVTKMLENRNPKKKSLTIVSDLATTNRFESECYKKFNITHAGCSAHARRPFWRWKDQDTKLCYWMLSAFLVLEQIEDRIDELGRTREHILRYRQRHARKVWQAILKRCESVVRGEKIYGNYWPKSSSIYKACDYIVMHYEELTRYLSDPRLPSTNNLSERILRWDKIMEDASKFRFSEIGRLQVDILRTIVHTCSAARVELHDYLLFIFKNRSAIKDDPSQFTPYAFALLNDAAPIAAKKQDTVANST